MPAYIVIHRHEYGASVYQVHTDFDLIRAAQDYEDWPERLASVAGIDFEPRRREEIEIIDPDNISESIIKEEDFLKVNVEKEEDQEDED